VNIGILGGTGPEGKGLALRFAAAGIQVVLGSRVAVRAEEKAAEYNSILGKQVIRGTANSEMLHLCEMVFLAVPFRQAIEAIEAIRGDLSSGTVLVDVTVPAVFSPGRVEYLAQEGDSGAETLARHIPAGIELVGAFKTIPAHVLAELKVKLDCDVFVCGDSRQAKELVMQAVRTIPTLRPLDAGPLRNARTLERMTILEIQLNLRYKSKGARFRVVGI